MAAAVADALLLLLEPGISDTTKSILPNYQSSNS